jgi:hypothetical protein
MRCNASPRRRPSRRRGLPCIAVARCTVSHPSAQGGSIVTAASTPPQSIVTRVSWVKFGPVIDAHRITCPARGPGTRFVAGVRRSLLRNRRSWTDESRCSGSPVSTGGPIIVRGQEMRRNRMNRYASADIVESRVIVYRPMQNFAVIDGTGLFLTGIDRL